MIALRGALAVVLTGSNNSAFFFLIFFVPQPLMGPLDAVKSKAHLIFGGELQPEWKVP